MGPIVARNCILKVSKGAKIRNRYNQVPHLTQDTNGNVTNVQLDTTNECQEFDILSFSETWLNSSVTNGDIFLLSYYLPERKYRVADSHGGVIFYIKFHIHMLDVMILSPLQLNVSGLNLH